VAVWWHTDVKIVECSVWSSHQNVAPGAGMKSAIYDFYDLFGVVILQDAQFLSRSFLSVV